MKEIFKPGITNRALGECSYLAACSNRGCRYLHYEIDERDKQKVADKQIRPVAANLPPELQLSAITDANSTVETRPAEWIRCDIRSIDVSVLGQFGVIMMDPPWRINMNLPYETMSDEEMLDMKIAPLQTDGVCCLWVVSPYTHHTHILADYDPTHPEVDRTFLISFDLLVCFCWLFSVSSFSSCSLPRSSLPVSLGLSRGW